MDLQALWSARRGRREAVAAIAPLLAASRKRLPVLNEASWRDPYVIGFFGMLITLIARRASPSIGSEAIGAVQESAWTEITGRRHDDIGEAICLLSASKDAAFEVGCRNAGVVFDAIAPTAEAPYEKPPELEVGAPNIASVEALWSRYFDDHIFSVGTTAQVSARSSSAFAAGVSDDADDLP
jgi:hypothetical protein